MMEHEERIRLLLSMQEHPEQYSDEQLQQLLASDPELTELLDELALTKQAFVKREADEETIPVEEEWQRFLLAQHLSSRAGKGAGVRLVFYKMAASFIGLLFISGLTFAAIHIARSVGEDSKSPTHATRISNPHQLADTLMTDTVATAQPVVFDNTPLEKLLPQIAAYYHKEVEFANADARLLRFYFVWKPEEGLEVTLHRLNLFESVNMELKENRIVVE